MTEQDKQALIKHFCSRDCGEESAKECQIMPCHEIELIQEFPTTEALPPAQPERIKGHWIEIALSNHTYKCSVCGRLLVNITDGKNNVAKNYPYCHCGAEMREVME